jgi:hypothetical protein
MIVVFSGIPSISPIWRSVEPLAMAMQMLSATSSE